LLSCVAKQFTGRNSRRSRISMHISKDRETAHSWRAMDRVLGLIPSLSGDGIRGEFSKRKYGYGFGNHGKVIGIRVLVVSRTVIVFEALLQEGVSGLSG
jgi:hypothetical protein